MLEPPCAPESPEAADAPQDEAAPLLLRASELPWPDVELAAGFDVAVLVAVDADADPPVSPEPALAVEVAEALAPEDAAEALPAEEDAATAMVELALPVAEVALPEELRPVTVEDVAVVPPELPAPLELPPPGTVHAPAESQYPASPHGMLPLRTGLEHWPVVGSHTPSPWQLSVGAQVTVLPGLPHTPAWHVSPTVHRLWSSQGVPSARAGVVHNPVASKQAPGR